MRSIFFLLAVLLGTSSSSMAPDLASAQSAPALELQLTRDSRPDAFLLSAVNRGKTDLLVVRPRSGMVDHFGSWGGWSVLLQGPDGACFPLPVPGAIPPFTSQDLVELRPGESIGVLLEIDRYVNDKLTAIGNAPGNYTMVARYHLDQDVVPAATGETFIAVPRLPTRESSAVSFVIEQESGHRR